MNKKIRKKIEIIFMVVFSIIILAGAFFWIRTLSLYSSNGCNLGTWNFGSYYPSTNTITVNAGASNYKSAGNLCYRTSAESDALNVIPGIDKNSCNAFFCDGAWNDEFNTCNPAGCDNWFDNKQIISFQGSCSTTCNDPGGCLAYSDPNHLSPGQSSVFNYSVSFDGKIVGMPTPYNSWMPITCTGGFIVGLKETAQTYYRYDPSSNSCSQIQLIQSQATNNDYSTLSECQSNIISFNKNYYYISNNQCLEIVLSSSQVNSSYYSTLDECQANLTTNNDLLTPILWIAGAVLFVIILFIIYLSTRRRR